MSWLLGILGSFFKAIVGGFVDDQAKRRAEDAQRQAGQLEQKTVDQQSAIDAQRRMQDAAAKPIDTEKDLADGKF
jgi:hypothetical protein